MTKNELYALPSYQNETVGGKICVICGSDSRVGEYTKKCNTCDMTILEIERENARNQRSN